MKNDIINKYLSIFSNEKENLEQLLQLVNNNDLNNLFNSFKKRY